MAGPEIAIVGGGVECGGEFDGALQIGLSEFHATLHHFGGITVRCALDFFLVGEQHDEDGEEDNAAECVAHGVEQHVEAVTGFAAAQIHINLSRAIPAGAATSFSVWAVADCRRGNLFWHLTLH